MDAVAGLLPFVVILLFFYLLIIRPARTRARKQQEMHEALRVGQEVMTGSGVYATITAVEPEWVVLELAPGVSTRWAKPAIARIVTEVEVEAGGETTQSVDDQIDLDRPDSHDRADGGGTSRA